MANTESPHQEGLPAYVAVGHNGLRVVSNDGRKWRDAQAGREGETYRAVAFGNQCFATVGSYGGDSIYATTESGHDWKTGKREAKYVRYLRGIGFGAGQFLSLGGDPGSVGSSNPFVVTSSDGIKWGDFVNLPGKHLLRRLAYGNGLFVAVGDRGSRSVSPDGLKWKDVEGAKAVDTLVDVVFGNGIFVGVGLHGLRMTTVDGATWSAPIRGEEGEHLNSVVWARDHFVAVGQGATYLSPNGRDWERKSNQNAPLTACYGSAGFVGLAWKGKILYSKDGINWEIAHQTEDHLEAVSAATA